MATETFGERLRRLRMRENVSQDQMAEALRTTRQTVSNWENDKCAIDYFSLLDLKKILHASWDELMGEEKAPQLHEEYRQGINDDNSDYVELRCKQGHTAPYTDLSNLSKAGDYRITMDDIQIAYSGYALPPHMLEIAKEAVELSFTVLEVDPRLFRVRLETDDKATEFRKFLDAFHSRGYEHAPRCELFANKYYDKYMKAERDFMDEGVKEIFGITADRILTLVSPGDGIMGYAGSIEEAKEKAEKLGLNKYSVFGE